MNIKKLTSRISEPKRILFSLAAKGLLNNVSDEAYLKLAFKLNMHKKLDLKNPKSFSEKLQWLKLYDRNPAYTMMVDKYEVKDYVASIIGEEYIIPTLGVWDHFDDIDFDALPDQFVLKCTHDSGGLVVVKDKASFDKDKAREKIEKCLKADFYRIVREWPYKNVKPRIIAEKYVEDKRYHELRDYKFFTFGGKVRAMFVAADRQTKNKETTFDFFDEDYNHLPFRQGHPNADTPPEKPINFEKMKELSELLAKDIPHVRVDFYEVNGEVYFGELTFYHFSGFTPFVPEEWDYKFGEWLELPRSAS